MYRKLSTLCTLTFAIALPCAAVQAQAVQSERAIEPRTEESASAGMFAPLTMAPRTDSQRAYVRATGGYDSQRGGPLFGSVVDATIFGPVALRVELDYGESSQSALRPSVGARVQILKQARHAIDMAVGAFYRPEGFTEGEGELETLLAFGRRIDRVTLLANLVYGQDPEGAERDGEVRLATLVETLPHFQTGLDTRMRFDLGSDETHRRREGGAKYDIMTGVLGQYALGPLCLLANLGFHGVGASTFQSGVVALAGVGGSL